MAKGILQASSLTYSYYFLERNRMVYVQNIEGHPLMPTTRYGKVRRMLKNGLAKVVQREPFTIRLNYETTEFTQPISLGIDSGSVYIGVSATTQTKEIYAAEVQLRTDIVDLIATRMEARSSRRNRKTRYRKPRFNNRRRKEGWFAPSIENRIQTHLRVIEKLHTILPVSAITIEVAQFDTQLIKNPEIMGEQYQQGEQLGFWNIREYVLCRDNHICQHCHGKSKDKVLNVHHLKSRKTGGNSPGNLITLCETCHKQYHQGKFELKIKRNTSLRDAAAMGIMRWELYNRTRKTYPNVHLTYGYITKNTRIRSGLQKSHAVDARCISGNPNATPGKEYFFIRQTRRHNRQIHKANILRGGVRKLNQAPFEVKGFRLFDKVLFDKKECFVFGRRSSGYFDLRTLDGTRIHASANCKKLKLLQRSTRMLTEKRN